jgi:hypothetical protein
MSPNPEYSVLTALPHTASGPSSIGRLLRAIHKDERGTVSLETVLILAAVGLPVLIIILKFGWPKIKSYFDKGMEDLGTASDRAIQGD